MLQFSFSFTSVVFYITDRKQKVLHNGCLSSIQTMSFGIHKDPCLSRCYIYVLYTTELNQSVVHIGHKYGDECQIYTDYFLDAVGSIDMFTAGWASTDSTSTRPKHMSFRWLSTAAGQNQRNHWKTVLSLQITTDYTTRDLGVIIDSQMSLFWTLFSLSIRLLSSTITENSSWLLVGQSLNICCWSTISYE